MSVVNGQLTTCERCGVQIFRKATGEGEMDGGFTRWNNFEPYPEGWDIVAVPKKLGIGYDHIRVCPACHETWNQAIIDHFISNTRLEKAKEG